MPLRRFGQDDGPIQHGPDTVRVWMSERRWKALLKRVGGQERRQSDRSGTDRRAPRFDASCRCLLRLDDGPGIFTVRSRNLGAKGIGFIHAQALDPETRCSLVIENDQGAGTLASGQVVWNRRIDLDLYDTGVVFDQPIAVDAFV